MKIASPPFSIHYDSLLQNARDIVSKCNSYFITKCVRSLLQKQNATIDTKCAAYCKLRWYNHLLIRLNSLTKIL